MRVAPADFIAVTNSSLDWRVLSSAETTSTGRFLSWGTKPILNDESSFQPDAGECYNEAISAVAGKIIFNSSAGPGWYADARRDIVRNVEN
jgi:hypothetical protein